MEIWLQILLFQEKITSFLFKPFFSQANNKRFFIYGSTIPLNSFSQARWLLIDKPGASDSICNSCKLNGNSHLMFRWLPPDHLALVKCVLHWITPWEGVSARIMTKIDRVICPMLNPIQKSIHFFRLAKFWGTLWFFTLVNSLKLVQLSIGYMLVNIELTKFV